MSIKLWRLEIILTAELKPKETNGGNCLIIYEASYGMRGNFLVYDSDFLQEIW